jgi:elongation factor G
MEQLKNRLRANPVIITRPWGEAEDFNGVLDLLRLKFYTWDDENLGAEMVTSEVPSEAREEAETGKRAILEALAETDDEIMEAYLADQEIPVARVSQAIRAATINLKLTPVFSGAALRNKGVQPLLDGIVDYLPAPYDLPPIAACGPQGKEILVEPKELDPVAGLVFKIQMMEQGRKMSFLRLYSGKIKEGDEILNIRPMSKDKIGRILRLNAGKRERVPEALAGDLVGIVGLRSAVTGDTYTSPSRPLLLESIKAADPVISVAVEPENSSEQPKLLDALTKMTEEDPTFKIKTDEDTGQTIISGMGELHLEVLIQRLGREFGLNPRVGRPQVVYRETISKAALGEGLFDREYGGVVRLAKAVIKLSPLQRTEGFKITSYLTGQEPWPPKLSEAALDTIKDSLNTGPIMGYPLLDLEAVLVSLELGEGQTDEPPLRIAVSQAIRNALALAAPILMEPIMKLEITSPEEFTGFIIGDLSSRLGRVDDMKSDPGGFYVISAKAPLAELFGYSTNIRSQTQGRGSFLMHFDRFDVVERKHSH